MPDIEIVRQGKTYWMINCELKDNNETGRCTDKCTCVHFVHALIRWAASSRIYIVLYHSSFNSGASILQVSNENSMMYVLCIFSF